MSDEKAAGKDWSEMTEEEINADIEANEEPPLTEEEERFQTREREAHEERERAATLLYQNDQAYERAARLATRVMTACGMSEVSLMMLRSQLMRARQAEEKQLSIPHAFASAKSAALVGGYLDRIPAMAPIPRRVAAPQEHAAQ